MLPATKLAPFDENLFQIFYVAPMNQQPQIVREAYVKYRSEQDSKCERAWELLVNGTCASYSQAVARIHGLTKASFARWAARYHRGEIKLIRSTDGRAVLSRLAGNIQRAQTAPPTVQFPSFFHTDEFKILRDEVERLKGVVRASLGIGYGQHDQFLLAQYKAEVLGKKSP